VLFDGTCGLCDRTVHFVLARDRRARFRFAPLQGRYAHEVLRRHGKDPARLDTFRILCDPGTPSERVRSRSDAALFLAARLPFPWPLLIGLRLVPRFLRDAAYRRLARSRHRLFGTVDACRASSPGERDRFIPD
jgi:predicted DCC family thiol-disulfide oxidoreductase YuxK